jgi:ABC-type molybdenum transport system ATPase subunit/photorepair protein PhrA
MTNDKRILGVGLECSNHHAICESFQRLLTWLTSGNETTLLIFGPHGAGKTALVHNALVNRTGVINVVVSRATHTMTIAFELDLGLSIANLHRHRVTVSLRASGLVLCTRNSSSTTRRAVVRTSDKHE